MALIVGVHFFALAALFRVKIYYLVGAILCLLAIITLFAVPESVNFDGQQITAQWVVLGFGSAIILWGVGLGLWLLGKRLLTLSEATEVYGQFSIESRHSTSIKASSEEKS
jgi:hypothetical protein